MNITIIENVWNRYLILICKVTANDGEYLGHIDFFFTPNGKLSQIKYHSEEDNMLEKNRYATLLAWGKILQKYTF